MVAAAPVGAATRNAAAALGLALLAAAGAPGPARGEPPRCLVSVRVEPARAFVGQRVDWSAEILRRLDVSDVGWRSAPAFPGFRAEWLPGRMREETRRLEGRDYRVGVERRALFPARRGRLATPPASLACDGVPLAVPGAAVEVRGLPEAGRPPGFAGLVGPVRVVTRLDPERVALGGSARLWVLLRGEGNVWAAPPPLAEGGLEDVDVFADPPSLEIDADPGFRARRTFRYRLVPRRAGQHAIPAVEVPWFDADAGRYRVARGAARTLVVDGTAMLPDEESP